MNNSDLIEQEGRLLFDRFASRLLEKDPASVLDVGTGSGRLLRILMEEGIRAVGLDASLPEVRDPAWEMVQGDAGKLPYPDGSFGWVALRHVPHHLPDVPAALAEACRVAEEGVLLSEPWFDLTEPTQRVALRWDLWEKAQHERGGMLHKPALSAGELCAALPEGDFDIETEHYRHHRLVPLAAIEERAAPLLAKLPEEHEDRAEWAKIREAIRETGLSYNGTLILTLWQID
jgi:SAM-dependent methyltransferase